MGTLFRCSLVGLIVFSLKSCTGGAGWGGPSCSVVLRFKVLAREEWRRLPPGSLIYGTKKLCSINEIDGFLYSYLFSLKKWKLTNVVPEGKV